MERIKMPAKIRVYLDTNMIHDYFVNQARAVKTPKNVVMPSKYKFMVTGKENIEFVTSVITKAEIARELRSGHGLDRNTIEAIWNDLIAALSCNYIPKHEFDDKLAEIALSFPLKLRTLFNFMHLFIAIHLGCYIVSGDRDFLEVVKKNLLYDKAIDYIELRKLMEGL